MLAFALATAFVTGANAAPSVLPKTGQPTKSGKPGTFEVVGDSGVSAMQLFLGTDNRVYIVDKTENNPARVRLSFSVPIGSQLKFPLLP